MSFNCLLQYIFQCRMAVSLYKSNHNYYTPIIRQILDVSIFTDVELYHMGTLLVMFCLVKFNSLCNFLFIAGYNQYWTCKSAIFLTDH